LYSSPGIIRKIKSRRMRGAGHVTRMGENIAYRIYVGNPERMRPLGIPRRNWNDIIKMYRKGIGGGGMDWIHLIQDRD
jgi:hypothetical protein